MRSAMTIDARPKLHPSPRWGGSRAKGATCGAKAVGELPLRGLNVVAPTPASPRAKPDLPARGRYAALTLAGLIFCGAIPMAKAQPSGASASAGIVEVKDAAKRQRSGKAVSKSQYAIRPKRSGRVY